MATASSATEVSGGDILYQMSDGSSIFWRAQDAASVGRKSAAPSAIFRAGITAIRPSRRPVWENARKDGGRRCAFPPYLLITAENVIATIKRIPLILGE